MTEPTSADYRLVVAKIIDIYAARYPQLLGYQADLAKWLLASLLVVNGGALAAIFQSARVPVAATHVAAAWFGVGIGLAVASGLAAYLNMAVLLSVYDDVINPNAITDPAKWELAKPIELAAVRWFAWISIALGILSLGAAAVGAWRVWSIL
jgi:hypothetical protein